MHNKTSISTLFLFLFALASQNIIANAPQNLSISQTDVDQVQLNWEAPPNSGSELVFHESFEGLTDDTFPPSPWQNIDNDQDGNKWILFDVPYSPNLNPYPAFHGDNAAASYSWFNGQVLTPDNWLITPAINISQTTVLQWAVAAQRPNFSQEHYKVFISTEGSDIENFTSLLHEETLAAQDITWKTRQIDLSNYMGQEIHIAFVHTQTTDLFAIKIDDIRFYQIENESLQAYNVYKNGEFYTQLENIIDTEFTDSDLTLGTHEYYLTAVYDWGESEASNTVSITIQVPDLEFAPNNVSAELDSDIIHINWEAPELQAQLLWEDFEELTETNFPPEGWQNIDNDGGGMSWILFDVPYSPEVNPYPAYSGEKAIASYSWYNGVTHQPDNWFITPAIQLQNQSSLSWAVAAQRPAYSQEHYKVYLSNQGSSIENFTTLLHEETLPDQDITWKLREIDLSDYDGQQVHIAFVHTETTDLFAIKLDAISIEGNTNLNLIGYEVYRNNELLANIDHPNQTSFEDHENISGVLNYSVKAVFEEGISVFSEPAEIEVYELSLNTQPENIAVLQGAGRYKPGTDIEIVAESDDSYIFEHWLDADMNVISTEENFSFTQPNQNTLLTAHYSDINQIAEVENAGFKIFPNPANSYINFYSELPIQNLRIYDGMGKMIESYIDVRRKQIRVHLTNYPIGLYSFELETQQKVYSDKFIIE